MKALWEKFNNSHLSKFIFVGGLNTLVGYGTFALFLFLGVHYIIASAISTVAGVTNSYFWNKYFTFRAPGKSYKEMFKFISVYGVQYAIGVSGLIFFVEVLNLHPLIGQAIVLVIGTIISFFGHKHWTFKKPEQPLP